MRVPGMRKNNRPREHQSCTSRSDHRGAGQSTQVTGCEFRRHLAYSSDMERPARNSRETTRGDAARRRFVVLSGLPGSGKTTLAKQLALALNLPLIDKDEILDRLFGSKGVGDAKWRRALSRESDVLFREKAAKRIWRFAFFRKKEISLTLQLSR